MYAYFFHYFGVEIIELGMKGQL